MTILSPKSPIYEGPYGGTLELFGTSSEIFGYSRVVFENTTYSKLSKIRRIRKYLPG